MFTSTKPRSAASSIEASSAHSSSIFAGGRSSSWASRCVSTGSSATMRMASIALAFSPVIGVHRGHGAHPAAFFRVGGVAADPGDRDVAEVGELVELDEALLVHLEHGEGPHHHL